MDNRTEVQAQLERILASPGFSTSTRSAQFLRYCVEQSLKGNRDQIKESTVAIAVFGRMPDYDSKSDPIVRVQARRLREKLDYYYTHQGTNDPILITIPKGSYIPQTTRVLPQRKRDFSDWPTPPAEPQAAPSSRHTTLYIGGAAALLLVTIAIFAAVMNWRAHRRAWVPPLRPASEPVPLNANPGLERDPAWSPDGKFIAVAWDQEINSGANDSEARKASHIYIQRVGDPQPQLLSDGKASATNRSELRPAWSPDGKFIAFVRYLDISHFEVLRTNRETGAEEGLGRFSYYWPMPDIAPALDWSPDGRTLLVSEQLSVSSPVHLVQLNLATGERRQITHPANGTTGDLEAKYSPDGTQIAMHRGGYGDIYLVSVSGETSSSPARALTITNPGVRGLTWSRDGRYVLFGSRGNGNGWEIWQVDTNGKNLAPLVSNGFDATSPALSPDGLTLALEHDDHVTNLTAIPLAGGGEPHPFAPSSRQDYTPAWSPNGRRVAFISTRSGPMEIWLANADGSHMEQITQINGNGFPLSPTWSPDGQCILFALRHGGTTHLVVADIVTHITRQLTFGNGRGLSPMYSADGRQIYYVSNAGGQERVWHMSVRDSESDAPNAQPVNWPIYLSIFASTRRDPAGDTIVYPDTDQQLRLYRRHIDTGVVDRVYQTDRHLTAFDDICFQGDNLYLLLSSMQDPLSADLESINMRTGQMHSLRTFFPVPASMESGCSVSPDGRTLLLSTIEHENSNVYLTSFGSR